jgi:hypothetical protein
MALNHVNDVKHRRDRVAEMCMLSIMMEHVETQAIIDPLGRRLRQPRRQSRAALKRGNSSEKYVVAHSGPFWRRRHMEKRPDFAGETPWDRRIVRSSSDNAKQ